MTKQQKRIWILVLRSLILILYHNFRSPDKEPIAESDLLRKEMTKEILQLVEDLK